MKYSFNIIPIIMFLLILPFKGNSQVFEKQKNVSKSYVVNKDCNIHLCNKYGDIHIVPWDKDSAIFSIDIKVADKKEADADKILKAIDVEFTNTPYYLVVKTVFRDGKNTVISDITDYANNLLNIGKNVEINYIMNVPKTSSLKIENKYGNIYTTNHSGNVQFILSNGDFKANDLTGGDTKIDLSFGNGVVHTITKGKLNIGYSDFEIKNAEKLTIEDKSAKISIAKVGDINIDSKRGKYYIDTVETVTGQTDFSHINIYYLKKSFFLKSLYGEINLTEISNDFSFININSNYTDIKLCIQKSSSIN
ncbi:MAG: hypothetical protein HGB12_01225, partial [Bacteroidetes bacterium]|nr:hypothetical protein [Bacteroidota bacterium]